MAVSILEQAESQPVKQPTVPLTQVAATAEPLEVLEAQVRDVFGRVVYSHKTHEKCADDYQVVYRAISGIQIILSAVTTGSLLLALFGDTHIATVIGAVASVIVLAITMWAKDFDLRKESQKHGEAAHQLWGAREDYLSLLTDIRGRLVNVSELCTRRDQLKERLDRIYATAPRTTSFAYKRAQRALQVNEDLTFGDAEVDAFLPAALRRG